MQIANKELLDDFVQTHANAAKPLNKWVDDVMVAHWKSHADLKQTFPSADYVKNGRYVFNIGGNNFRVVAVVVFVGDVMYIRFVGTHAEYDKIDSTTI
jgi:mRNA interferase HigB